jgi:A/G-specific adenine glycosylase
MKFSRRRIQQFQGHIFSWWERNKRDLPWRHTHDPYKILVSEVMLQQTQVPRVLGRYREFIERYPTVNSLAKASTADVLKIWRGMGYNRRALYLKKAAAVGKIPKTEKELMKLPGVGKYTARAICVFAYKKNIAAVDTNIRQIITHFFFHDKPQKEKVIQNVADQLLPIGKSWEWHQALMDYGALEMPKLKIKKIKKSDGIPFKETNRYFRGRIIDVLRAGPIDEDILLQDFSAFSINGLIKEGLVERKKGVLGLPD